MTGILETMKAQLDGALADIAAIKAAMAGATPAPAPAADPFGGFGATPAPTLAPANVTAEMITGLIMPHTDNEAIKAQLSAHMKAMGINALGETQPHQYGELYQRFQSVIAAAAPAAAAPLSII